MDSRMNQVIHKIGQLMVFGFYGTKMTPGIKKMIDEFGLGNIILFSRNLDHPDQIRALTAELQTEAKRAGHKYPLLICTDQENGAVRRLGQGAAEFPGAMLLGATHSAENAFEIAGRTAGELKSVGINWNLAPVVDVNNNPDNPVICTRSFGEDPQEVAAMGKAFMKGLQGAGIVPTLKHFPGHGDTGVDSHLDLPVIQHDLERLEKVEFVPFRQCINSGADVIMSAHIYFPAIEKQYGLPATLSRSVLTGLLRQTMHFQGVITTDCLEMKAIADRFGTAQGAVMAFQAGADLAMVSHTYSKQVETLERVAQAIKDGDIGMESLRQSFERVELLKKKYLDWTSALNPEMQSKETSMENHSIAKKIYREGVTVVKKDKRLFPLSEDKKEKILFLYSEKVFSAKVEDQQNFLSRIKEAIIKRHPSLTVVRIESPGYCQVLDDAFSGNKKYQAIIVLTASLTKTSALPALIGRLKKSCPIPIAVIAGKSPYDLRLLPDVDSYICTYDLNETTLEFAIHLLFSPETGTGRLPVSL